MTATAAPPQSTNPKSIIQNPKSIICLPLSRRSREARRRIPRPVNPVIESLPLTLRAASSRLSPLRSDSVKKMLYESKIPCTMICDFYAKRDSQIIKYQQLMPDPFHSDPMRNLE
jgi:hypothetical protein